MDDDDNDDDDGGEDDDVDAESPPLLVLLSDDDDDKSDVDDDMFKIFISLTVSSASISVCLTAAMSASTSFWTSLKTRRDAAGRQESSSQIFRPATINPPTPPPPVLRTVVDDVGLL